VKPLGIGFRVWLCAHRRGVTVCPIKEVAVCSPKRCGSVPIQVVGVRATEEV